MNAIKKWEPGERPAAPGRTPGPALRRRFRLDPYVAAIALLAAFLNGFQIWTEHYANTYYTMTVASMLQSFHNFFFASLDSAGSVTVDKPPLTFWIQAASAYLFGVHGWSVILPQALAGVGSVFLMNALVKPAFGPAAGRIAALAMAATPVAVAVARTNNIDAMLVFTLLLATRVLFKAVNSGRLWTAVGAFALIGAAFNMKMLQAYMVLPAFYLFYLAASKRSWKIKAGHLAAATAVMLVLSTAWAVIVDSIPADKRPYIGSSSTNSVLELAFGYNGVSRLTGNQGPGGGRGGIPPGGTDGMPGAAAGSPGGQSSAADGGAGAGAAPGADGGQGGQAAAAGRTPGATGGQAAGDGGATGTGGAPGADGSGSGASAGQPSGFANDGQRSGRAGGDFGQGGPGGQGGQGGAFNTGTKGPLRLFQSELSGQASWLLPFVLFAVIGLLAGLRRRLLTRQHLESLFWLAWLLPVMGFFSIAGFFHQYYLIMMAPPIAALVGAGWNELWAQYRGGSGWRSWLLPAGVLATAAFAWFIMRPYDTVIGKGWSLGILLGGLAVSLLLALAPRLYHRLPVLAASLVGVVLFAGPLYWAATPITYGQNSMLPAAGPGGSAVSGPGGMGRFPGGMAQPGGDGTGRTGGMPGNASGAPADASGAPSGSAAIPGDAASGSYEGRQDGRNGGMPGGPGQESLNEKALAYLKEHNTGEEYLFAASDYGTAAPYIIDAGEKVISLGGFSGNDPVYTAAKLEELVSSGQVKYFMLSGRGMGGRGGSSELTAWIEEHGTLIPSEEWQGTAAGSASGSRTAANPNGSGAGGFPGSGNAQLYEVKL
ncbi:glycosyltransferase family 39 protein [Paenibacillus aurantius]|uniref:Glycosyltransferase family 39 protein n=1 Tax=Paenibacillus aurantius TaxID=2918900 RepID=A0AA96LBH7_9BACL|nr:glycosyltransferase family 39 protein [Paenibacillus aurantius]WNQ10854.1 glycosyltransferase family 39 protein [Paenibacillus aurantius]